MSDHVDLHELRRSCQITKKSAGSFFDKICFSISNALQKQLINNAILP